ncbi:hypothetical protein JCM18750_35630 [Halostagnicola bangensis]
MIRLNIISVLDDANDDSLPQTRFYDSMDVNMVLVTLKQWDYIPRWYVTQPHNVFDGLKYTAISTHSPIELFWSKPPLNPQNPIYPDRFSAAARGRIGSTSIEDGIPRDGRSEYTDP